jgi:hypothetical protein
MVTEVGTGLGLLGSGDLDEILRSRPAVMRTLSPEDWDDLAALRASGSYDAEFHAAWENGKAFLSAADGLRGRRPVVVEWKGSGRAPGDEVAPIDLRVDHVYLISCKYLSHILFNVSPANVFDLLRAGGSVRRGRDEVTDWYAEVAPEQYQELYAVVRWALVAGPPVGAAAGTNPAGDAPALPGLGFGTEPDGGAVSAHSRDEIAGLPERATELTTAQRKALGLALRGGWPDGAREAYQTLSNQVASASAARWRAALSGGTAASESMLWRLLRMGATPYFVLGTDDATSLRLRIATAWDWRQQFALRRFEVFAQPGGQPRVGWTATVRHRATGETTEVAGHIEVRWSHGRFAGNPEAKGYLDTPHHLVPGYFALR